MIKLKTPEEIAILREGGRRLAEILSAVAEKIAPGIKTGELDDLAHQLIIKGGDEPAFLNYRPSDSRLYYPASLCVSINEEIVHGIPKSRKLVDGDIVGLDLGLKHRGFYTDMAMTVPVGKVSQAAQKLIKITREALAVGIKVAHPGGHIGDIGAAISSHVHSAGLKVVQELAGHGVGFAVHEDPYVPNEGQAGTGEKLEPGLVIAIEPMVTAGSGVIRLEKDGYTFSTQDRAWSAHFEQTIAITESGVIILTE